MPINYATLKTNLYNWAVLVLPANTPIIFLEQNSPRPNVFYVTLFLNPIVAVHQDWTQSSTNNAGIVEMKGDRQFTLQIQAYGGSDPLTVLENVRSSLQKQSVLDTLRVNGIAFYSSSDIIDITDLIDSRYEKRASMDILFSVGQTYTDNTGYFDHTLIEQTIENVDGSIIINAIFPVPEL